MAAVQGVHVDEPPKAFFVQGPVRLGLLAGGRPSTKVRLVEREQLVVVGELSRHVFARPSPCPLFQGSGIDLPA